MGSQKAIWSPPGNDDSRIIPISTRALPPSMVGADHAIHCVSAHAHHVASGNTAVQDVS